MVKMDEYEIMDKMEELKKLQKEQEAIKLENALLSEHLSRIVTRKGSMQIHLENLEAEEQEREAEEKEKADAAAALAAATAADATKRRRSTKRSFRVFQEVQRPSVKFFSPLRDSRKPRVRAPMSLEEKLEVVDDEIGCHNEQMNRLRAENNRVLDDLRAVFEETDYGIKDLASEKNTIQRDLMILAEINPRRKLYTEDFLRFQGEKLRKKRNIREKLQEKIDILHMEVMDAEHQFSTKRDLKDILHVIDFDQLKIQRIQLRSRIRLRTSEVWRYKALIKNAGAYLCLMQLLMKARKDLEEKVEEGRRIRQSIVDRTPQISSSQVEINVEKKIQRSLNEDILRLIQEQDGPPQPHVLDYMRYRIKVAELRRELKTWLSKVDVIEQSHIRLRNHVRYVRKQRDAILAASPDILASLPDRGATPVQPKLAPVKVSPMQTSFTPVAVHG
ncbi:coiled-coil domain-containing protein 113 [Selaginella moellendorffii]|uniref:coiled-coil domain-containing protein 113 n=1 Tax=Selaginella moellendorffii TaxID=88036 RepID=UPI000D1C2A15|nr:coiled-coil domain-containing protein 113 [Selaginella moellendorffii]|eukprot:XP_024543946.1 coiled-coil domain-containing protein 113 [Selaginella moellendorffii]